jgi:hypothetical protein
MRPEKGGDEWIDQSLKELIEIDPDKDFKGYKNPETLRQALGRPSLKRYEEENQRYHHSCDQFDPLWDHVEAIDEPIGANKDHYANRASLEELSPSKFESKELPGLDEG